MNFTNKNILISPLQNPTTVYTHCPYCNHDKYYLMRRKKYRCARCKREWSFRKGTELEHTTMSPEKYGKVVALIKQGKSITDILHKTGATYYAVYKILCAKNKNMKYLNSSVLKEYKRRLHLSNFSIAQSTGLSMSTVAKMLSKAKKYRVHYSYYKKTYEFLYGEIVKLKSRNFQSTEAKDNNDDTLYLPEQTLLAKKQSQYIQDIVFLARLIGSNDFNHSLPLYFFYDYLYRAKVNKTTMERTFLFLLKKGYITVKKGFITSAKGLHHVVSHRQKTNLISSLASYLDKNHDSPQAYGWSLLLKNKKNIDSYLVKGLIYYETKADFTKRQKLISLYEEKYKRTSKYIYASLLYHKVHIASLYLGKIPIQYKLIRSFFKTIGLFQNQISDDIYSKLKFEIHQMFFFMYTYFQNLDCLYLNIKTKEYYLNYINTSNDKYSLYHLLTPTYHLIDKNNKIILSKLLKVLLQLNLVEKSPVLFQNSYYTFLLFYNITENNVELIKKYFQLVENNSDKEISLVDILNRYDPLFLIAFNNKKYYFAFIILLQWACDAHDNKYRLFNIFIYLRIILQKIDIYDIKAFIDHFFKHSKLKKTHLWITFTPEKTVKGLQQILKLCQVYKSPEVMDPLKMIHWIDNFMIAFRQKTYTKKMLKSSTNRFIKKIRKIDKTIEHKTGVEFLPVLKSILSHNPKEAKNPIPHASSENLILLHSSYYCLYEHLFLPEKTVSKKFPPIVPHYIQRLLDS